MHGNLVACVCDEDYERPIWLLVACHDLQNAAVALSLYQFGTSGASSQEPWP